MMKTMEKIVERLAVGDRPTTTQQLEPQIRNHNFRRQQFPQIRQRNPNENHIRPPFQEKTVVEELEENDDQIHCLVKDEPQFYESKKKIKINFLQKHLIIARMIRMIIKNDTRMLF